MKTKKLKLLASVFFVFSLSSCSIIFKSSDSSGTTIVDNQVTSVSVDPEGLALSIGDTYTIGAHCLPEKASQEVTWTSSKLNVAKVDKNTGLITAIGAGTTRIIATSVSNPRVTGYCTLTVAAEIIHATKVTLDKESLSINKDATAYLHYTITPTNATGGVILSSLDNSIAKVEKTGTGTAKVTGVSYGTTIIRATSASDNEIFAECEITVNKVQVTGISLDKKALTVSTGSQTTLSVKVLPSDASVKDVIWSSSDNNILSVDDSGVITAKKAGTATITVQSVDKPELTDSCVFTVEDVHPTAARMDRAKVCMSLDSTSTLEVLFTPVDASNKNVTWTTSNASIVSVEKTNSSTTTIYAKAYGTCVVTATTEDGGFIATSEITVAQLGKTESKYNYEDYTDHNVHDIDAIPSTGNPKMVVVPVWMNDSTNYIKDETQKANVRADIEKAYFGTNEETGWRSVKTYYEEESFGQLHLDGVVTDWYDCKYSSSFCGEDATTSIAVDVSRWFKMNNPSTYSDYDTNGDGYLDAVILIYAAPDYRSSSSKNDNLWAYCYWTDEEVGTRNDPTPKAFFWASYDFMYSKNHPNSGGYGGGDTTHCSIDTHTYIHEMGHILGLSDYYDYNGGYSASGRFSMQDNNVGGHDPYSKLALNWVEPYVPTKSMTIKIKPIEYDGEVILLSPDYTGSPFDEYILIELYTPFGLNEFDCTYPYKYPYAYPQGPSTVGCRVWHVDSRLAYLVNGRSLTLSSTPDIENDKLYLHAFTNSAFKTANDGRCSPLARSAMDIYARGRQLQLIRKNYIKDETCGDNLNADALFQTGDTFNMTKYGKCFVNNGKLNSGKELGFSVNFDSVSATGAVITITKG